jgi:Mg2+ and Co2+ transporter CorA
MNTWVPWEQKMIGFFVIVGVMVAMLAGMIGYFRHRGWL